MKCPANNHLKYRNIHKLFNSLCYHRDEENLVEFIILCYIVKLIETILMTELSVIQTVRIFARFLLVPAKRESSQSTEK